MIFGFLNSQSRNEFELRSLIDDNSESSLSSRMLEECQFLNTIIYNIFYKSLNNTLIPVYNDACNSSQKFTISNEVCWRCQNDVRNILHIIGTDVLKNIVIAYDFDIHKLIELNNQIRQFIDITYRKELNASGFLTKYTNLIIIIGIMLMGGLGLTVMSFGMTVKIAGGFIAGAFIKNFLFTNSSDCNKCSNGLSFHSNYLEYAIYKIKKLILPNQEYFDMVFTVQYAAMLTSFILVATRQLAKQHHPPYSSTTSKVSQIESGKMHNTAINANEEKEATIRNDHKKDLVTLVVDYVKMQKK